jgi:hypothetical protein
MKIYGAGMAGLLAAHMLRRYSPVVREKAESLPHNHEAVLRFRTDAVSRATAIPFKKVRVTKAIVSGGALHETPRLDLVNRYSLKVTGQVIGRSIESLEPVERYIAPPNFIELLAQGVSIKYGLDYEMTSDTFFDGVMGELDGQPFISTVPLPITLQLIPDEWAAELPPLQFDSFPIWSIIAEVQRPVTEAYQTLYYPDDDVLYYRGSLTGSRLTIECISKPVLETVESAIREVLSDFGIRDKVKLKSSGKGLRGSRWHIHHSQFGKLLPVDHEHRKRIIFELTSRYNMYSVGRFATWRQLLLDDVVKDIELVGKWISAGSNYARRLDSTK